MEWFGIMVPVLLLAFGWVVGRNLENEHYASIRAREEKFLRVPVLTSKTVDFPERVHFSILVTGSVVISIDYYKRFMAMLRNIFGGEMHAYSPLIDRARREAVLRMKESFPSADAFFNFRYETSSVSKGRAKTTRTVEVLAYATAVRYLRVPPAPPKRAG